VVNWRNGIPLAASANRVFVMLNSVLLWIIRDKLISDLDAVQVEDLGHRVPADVEAQQPVRDKGQLAAPVVRLLVSSARLKTASLQLSHGSRLSPG
jgi:hypothetical protein